MKFGYCGKPRFVTYPVAVRDSSFDDRASAEVPRTVANA